MRSTLGALLCVFSFLSLCGCHNTTWLSRNVGDKSSVPVPLPLQQKMALNGMDLKAPILIRIFKEENLLEIWKEKRDKAYALIASYKICRWSGRLGPKYLEGDLQSPEGFYNIYPHQLNPYSHYYLSFDIGYPNVFDRQNGATGGHVMVHGGCASVGCYSMQDKNIAQIYAFARDAFSGGQRFIQVQALPFRLTEENMARYRKDSNYAFWKMLKVGYDIFETTRRPPRVKVVHKHYVFSPLPIVRAKNIRSAIRQDGRKEWYATPFEYVKDVLGFLHRLRPPKKTLHNREEARHISIWTHKLIHGQRVESLSPPYDL